MNIISQDIIVQNEILSLTNQRAIFWAKENALILSDIHIGKTAHFRRHGIPLPNEILKKDLERLKLLILHFKAEKLFVVGDLFHAESNIDVKTFKIWLEEFKTLEIVLVKGNHDRLTKQMVETFPFRIEKELEVQPFLFVHEPKMRHLKMFTISGHTHPGVCIKGKGKQRIKLPCYLVNANQIVLPAFSLFTGLNTKSKPKNAVCYGFTDTAIFKL